MKGKVIKRGQGKIIMEGDECTEIYAFTDKIAFSITFSASSLDAKILLRDFQREIFFPQSPPI